MNTPIADIIALHHNMPNLAAFDVYVCAECQKKQPCPTLRMLLRTREAQRDAWMKAAQGVKARREAAECPPTEVQAYEGEEILVRRRDGRGWRLPAKQPAYHWVSVTETVR